jgi:hypothetical protein
MIVPEENKKHGANVKLYANSVLAANQVSTAIVSSTPIVPFGSPTADQERKQREATLSALSFKAKLILMCSIDG